MLAAVTIKLDDKIEQHQKTTALIAKKGSEYERIPEPLSLAET